MGSSFTRRCTTKAAVLMVSLALVAVGCSRSNEVERTSTHTKPAGSGSASAPEGWPQGIPVPADFEPISDNRVDMGGEVTINWAGTTKDSVQDITSLYSKGMTGWDPGDSGTVAGQPANSYLGFKRAKERLMVNIADGDGERTLNLSYSVTS